MSFFVLDISTGFKPIYNGHFFKLLLGQLCGASYPFVKALKKTWRGMNRVPKDDKMALLLNVLYKYRLMNVNVWF